MKTWVFKIFSFIIITFLVGLISLLILMNWSKTEGEFFLGNKIHKLFVGDSHFRDGINDSLIPNSKNLGCSQESPLYTYLKLKVLLEQNPQIKNVFYSYSFDQLIDREMSKETAFLNSIFRVPIISPYLNLKDWGNILISTSGEALRSFGPIWDYNYHQLKNPISPFLNKIHFGGYISQEAKFTPTKGVISNHETYHFKTSKLNIHFIHKIIDLCRSNKVKLTLVSTPVHQSRQITFMVEYRKNKFTSHQFPAISYLNFTSLQLADSLFSDEHHLNKWGANIFSRIIRDTTGDIR